MTIYVVFRPEKIGENIKEIEEYLSDKDYSKRFVIGKEFEELGKKLNIKNGYFIKEKKAEVMGYKKKLDYIAREISNQIKTVTIKQKYVFSGE